MCYCNTAKSWSWYTVEVSKVTAYSFQQEKSCSPHAAQTHKQHGFSFHRYMPHINTQWSRIQSHLQSTAVLRALHLDMAFQLKLLSQTETTGDGGEKDWELIKASHILSPELWERLSSWLCLISSEKKEFTGNCYGFYNYNLMVEANKKTKNKNQLIWSWLLWLMVLYCDLLANNVKVIRISMPS